MSSPSPGKRRMDTDVVKLYPLQVTNKPKQSNDTSLNGKKSADFMVINCIICSRWLLCILCECKYFDITVYGVYSLS